MQAIGMMTFGDPDVLEVVDLGEPEPGPGEVRIRVHAVAVNPTDLSLRKGAKAADMEKFPAPYIPGVDLAGVIDKLGPDVDGRLSVGDRVVGFLVPFLPRGGSYAEQVVAPAASVVPAPKNASFPEASTLLLNALTARLALNSLALNSGETVAIIGGAGAVGGYAIQLAKTDGLTVISDASPKDRDLVTSLGADVVLERGDDIAKNIRNVVPEGVPGLIDTVALDEKVLPAVTDGGKVAVVRGWRGPGERGITIHGTSAYDASTETAIFDRLRIQADEGVLTLRVARVMPARDAAEAHRLLAEGGVRGRLVLDFSQPI